MYLEFPRNTGTDGDGVAQTEIDHFGNCPVCGMLIDMRDLGHVLAHVHDQEIEMGEGPKPPRREDAVDVLRRIAAAWFESANGSSPILFGNRVAGLS